MVKNFLMTAAILVVGMVWYHFTFGAGFSGTGKEFYVVNMEKVVMAKTVEIYKNSEYGDIDDSALDSFYSEVMAHVATLSGGAPVFTRAGLAFGGTDLTDVVMGKFGLDGNVDLDAIVGEKVSKVVKAQGTVISGMRKERDDSRAASLPGFDQ